MIFEETALKGAYTIDIDPHADDRGFFARTFCRREFEAHGLESAIAQTSIAFNAQAGTIRGMHFQYPPRAEAKVVRCQRGALLDVIIDLRPESPTFLHHVAIELSAANRRALYVPERFAHGYQTLDDNTEAAYEISEFHAPELADGLRYDDPALGLEWPLPVSRVSPRDVAWTLLARCKDQLTDRMAKQPPIHAESAPAARRSRNENGL